MKPWNPPPFLVRTVFCGRGFLALHVWHILKRKPMNSSKEVLPQKRGKQIPCAPSPDGQNGDICLANQRKRWDAKPEAVGAPPLCSFGCNIGKPVETLGQQSQRLRYTPAMAGKCAMLVRLPDTLRPSFAKKGRFCYEEAQKHETTHTLSAPRLRDVPRHGRYRIRRGRGDS